MTDAEKLRAIIRRSGLTSRKFAATVLIRDERTVRRWMAGDPVPAIVREWIDARFAELEPSTGASA